MSWAEAAAYARGRDARLPSEAEWRRAAEGAPRSPSANVHFRHGSPVPVASDPAGASAWGVLDLVGNAWEWTGSPFAPFPGFAAMPRYPGYSADFFDDDHFVMLGGSWATDEALLHPDPHGSREAWCRARVQATEARLAEAARTHPLVILGH